MQSIAMIEIDINQQDDHYNDDQSPEGKGQENQDQWEQHKPQAVDGKWVQAAVFLINI